MKSPIMYCHDPFDAYFARARLDELEQQQLEAEQASRRGSLPSPAAPLLRVEEPSGCRRARSCKLPSRKSRGSRRNSKSPSPRKQSLSTERQDRDGGSSGVGAGDSRTDITISVPQPDDETPPNGGISLNYVNEPTLRAPSPRLKCHSAPHSRSSSWKKQRRPGSMRAGGGGGRRDSESPAESESGRRSRSGSITANFEDEVASKLEQLRVLQESDVCIVRNFSSSRRKGVVNRGDSFKRKSRNVGSAERELEAPEPVRPPIPVLGSVDDGHDQRALITAAGDDGAAAAALPAVQPVTPPHRVVVAGDTGVGKTSLLQQFMTTDYMGALGTVFGDDNDCEKTVSVTINGQESMMEFIDANVEMDLKSLSDPDAYVLVFAINSKSSFQYVLETVREIRKWPRGQQVAVIVVANKSDLVRKRSVSEEDAKSMCNHYDCKYIETSAALNHQVDELLVGIVTQIRLNRKRQEKLQKLDSGAEQLTCVKGARGLFSKLFLRKPRYHVSKSCDNLLDL